MLPMCFVGLRASVWREHKVYENHTRCLTKFKTFFTSVIAGQFQEIIQVLDKNLDFFHVMQAFCSKIRL